MKEQLMSDFVEWNPKHHGHKPLHWTPDTLTGLDGKNYVRQPNWAWIAGSTYYVPYEAVYGVPRPAPVEEGVEPVDLLAEAWIEATGNTVGMGPLNEALAKRGLKIVEAGQ
jgi:hypothetical protein